MLSFSLRESALVHEVTMRDRIDPRNIVYGLVDGLTRGLLGLGVESLPVCKTQ